MLKNLRVNNRALSAVELVICFGIVSVVSIALFNVVFSYKDKEEEVSAKAAITGYKNTLTKAIQDDITKKILKEVTCTNPTYAKICKEPDAEYDKSLQANVENEITCSLKFATTGEDVKKLVINRLDNYIIYTEDNNKDVKYSIPNLGTSAKEKIGASKTTPAGYCKNVKTLRIEDFNVAVENNFFILDINFHHTRYEIGNKYGIHIIAPINFT